MTGPDITKQRDAPRTKAKILAAAQKVFSEQGYGQAGIRDIAAIAGVSSTLLLRYYGSKAGLFEAAFREAIHLEQLFALPKAEFGERLAALISGPTLDLQGPSMITLATGDAEAREVVARVTEELVIVPLAKWLGSPDGRARAVEIISLNVGFVLCTRQIPMAARGADKTLTKWLARALQAVVDQK